MNSGVSSGTKRIIAGYGTLSIPLLDRVCLYILTDDWVSYAKYILADKHVVGKRGTQKIENKNLLLSTRIKWLAGKIICFSKTEEIHDGVIGLFIKGYSFRSDYWVFGISRCWQHVDF